MLGNNEVVGRKYFDKAGDRLLVTSLFMTLQGEGPLRGEPAFFVRLAKCNLACSFCDTYFDGGDWFTPEELIAAIDQRIADYFEGDPPRWARYLEGYREPSGNPNSVIGNRSWAIIAGDLWVQPRARQMALVITGGEPMLQTNLGQFLGDYGSRFAKVQIESNGTLYQDLPTSTILVVSPKCVEVDGRPSHYLQPNRRSIERADCLKFVMEAGSWQESFGPFRGRHTVKETPYASVPEWAHQWAADTGKPVFVSPMNVYLREPAKAKQLRAIKANITLEERSTVDEVISGWEDGLLDRVANRRNHEWAARYCIRHGFTFNMQQHLWASVA